MSYEVNKKTNKPRKLIVEKARYNSSVIVDAEITGQRVWNTKKIKDFLSNEKLFYGRIDEENNPIVPRPKSLRHVGARTKSVYLQKFVADAFESMKASMDRSLSYGQADRQGSSLFPLRPVKGYVNPSNKYSNYISQLASVFVNNFLDSKKQEKIHDFESFLPFFEEYLILNAPFAPITKSGYVLSSFNSPLSSGLMVEVSNASYSDDKVKFEKFYSNPDFKLYMDTAYHNGFVIDKHIPWRLVADMNSPNMEKFIGKYVGGNDAGTYLYVNYKKTYREDIRMLARMALIFYNTLVTRFPFTQISKCSVPTIINRYPVDYEFVVGKLRVSYLFRLYVNIRNSETGIEYDRAEVNNTVSNALDIHRKVDRASAARYINSKFNNVEHYVGSRFYDITRRELSKDPRGNEESLVEIVQKSVQEFKASTF